MSMAYEKNVSTHIGGRNWDLYCLKNSNTLSSSCPSVYLGCWFSPSRASEQNESCIWCYVSHPEQAYGSNACPCVCMGAHHFSCLFLTCGQEIEMQNVYVVARLPSSLQGEQCTWGMHVCTLGLQVEDPRSCSLV